MGRTRGPVRRQVPPALAAAGVQHAQHGAGVQPAVAGNEGKDDGGRHDGRTGDPRGGFDRGFDRGSGHGIGLREIVAGSSALLMLVFLIKIYGVARYSLTTTTGLLVTTPVQVVLGTVAIYAYYVLPAIALGSLWFAVLYRRRVQWGVWPIVLAVAAVTALASPAKYLSRALAVVALSLLVELLVRWLLSRSGRASEDAAPPWWSRVAAGIRGLSLVYLGSLMLAWQFLASIEAPWVSAQAFLLDAPAVVSTHDKVRLDGDLKVEVERVFIGYPIDDNGGWTTVLHAETRYLVRIPSSSVRARLTCHDEDDQLSGDRSLMRAIQGRPYDSHNIDCNKVKVYLEQMKPGDQFQNFYRDYPAGK